VLAGCGGSARHAPKLPHISVTPAPPQAAAETRAGRLARLRRETPKPRELGRLVTGAEERSGANAALTFLNEITQQRLSQACGELTRSARARLESVTVSGCEAALASAARGLGSAKAVSVRSADGRLKVTVLAQMRTAKKLLTIEVSQRGRRWKIARVPSGLGLA
jgi:hypothetical protein